MSQASSRGFFSRFGKLQIGIIALVIITALIHLQLGIGAMRSFGGRPGGPPAGQQGRPPNGQQGGPPPGRQGGPPPGRQGGFNILQALPFPLPIMFLLNGIGYLVLLIALYLPALARYQRIIRWLLILFAAVTVVLYLAANGLRPNPLGLFAKAVEIVLIVLLLIEARQSARPPVAAMAG